MFLGSNIHGDCYGAESFQFQAETTRLLKRMIHSLYMLREIFLREMISNTSDTLDRLRFVIPANSELIVGDVITDGRFRWQLIQFG